MRAAGRWSERCIAIITTTLLTVFALSSGSAIAAAGPGIESTWDKDATAGSAVTGTLDGGPGLARPATLAWAVHGNRFGSTTLGAALTLAVPIETTPGSYSALATVSLFPID